MERGNFCSLSLLLAACVGASQVAWAKSPEPEIDCELEIEPAPPITAADVPPLKVFEAALEDLSTFSQKVSALTEAARELSRGGQSLLARELFQRLDATLADQLVAVLKPLRFRHRELLDRALFEAALARLNFSPATAGYFNSLKAEERWAVLRGHRRPRFAALSFQTRDFWQGLGNRSLREARYTDEKIRAVLDHWRDTDLRGNLRRNQFVRRGPTGAAPSEAKLTHPVAKLLATWFTALELRLEHQQVAEQRRDQGYIPANNIFENAVSLDAAARARVMPRRGPVLEQNFIDEAGAFLRSAYFWIAENQSGLASRPQDSMSSLLVELAQMHQGLSRLMQDYLNTEIPELAALTRAHRPADLRDALKALPQPTDWLEADVVIPR